MIPKIIHYSNFGPDELSDSFRANIQTWKDSNKDFEIHEWNRESLPPVAPFLEQAFQLSNLKNANLYTQLYVLNRYGGFFVNPESPINIDLNLLTGFECLFDIDPKDPDNNLDAGKHLLASSPNHPFTKSCLTFLIKNFVGSEPFNGNLFQSRLQFSELRKLFSGEYLGKKLPLDGLLLKSIVPGYKPVREKASIPDSFEGDLYLDDLKSELQRWTYNLPENLEKIKKIKAGSDQLFDSQNDNGNSKKSITNTGTAPLKPVSLVQAGIEKLEQAIGVYHEKLDRTIENLESYLGLNESRITVLTFNESTLREKADELYQLVLLDRSEIEHLAKHNQKLSDTLSTFQSDNKNLGDWLSEKDRQIQHAQNLVDSLQAQLASITSDYRKSEQNLQEQTDLLNQKLKDAEKDLQEQAALLNQRLKDAEKDLQAQAALLNQKLKDAEQNFLKLSDLQNQKQKEAEKLILEKNLIQTQLEKDVAREFKEKTDTQKEIAEMRKTHLAIVKKLTEEVIILKTEKELSQALCQKNEEAFQSEKLSFLSKLEKESVEKAKLLSEIKELKFSLTASGNAIRDEQKSVGVLMQEVTDNTRNISQLKLNIQILSTTISSKDAVLSQLMEDKNQLKSANDKYHLEIYKMTQENLALKQEIDWYNRTYEKRRLLGIIKDRLTKGLSGKNN
jgi:chromosome segregation ATPase